MKIIKSFLSMYSHMKEHIYCLSQLLPLYECNQLKTEKEDAFLEVNRLQGI